MNLAVLKKSRRKPDAGDVFVMQPTGRPFLYGRVISVDASGPMGVGCVLFYIYRNQADSKTPVPELLRGQLLVPPIMTNALPWSKGIFELVENRPLTPMDHLTQHCFKDTRGWYFDENGNRLTGPVEPVGSWGLDSFRTIDDKISLALGIEISPA